MFANGPGDLGSIPGRVIPKTQKMELDASLLNTQHYKVRIKGKVEQSREGVAPTSTHWCSSYRKGSLRVTLDYGRQLYLLYIYIGGACFIYFLHIHENYSHDTDMKKWGKNIHYGFNTALLTSILSTNSSLRKSVILTIFSFDYIYIYIIYIYNQVVPSA